MNSLLLAILVLSLQFFYCDSFQILNYVSRDFQRNSIKLRCSEKLLRPTMLADNDNVKEKDIMNFLKEGIKAVAVGVKGSKPIPMKLVPEIVKAIDVLDGSTNDSDFEPARQRLASFLGTLFVKHTITDSDEIVLREVASRRPQYAGMGMVRGGCSSKQLFSVACGDSVDSELADLCIRLLEGEKLNEKESNKIGKCLFSKSESAACRSLVAHVFRVRYETREEFAGLMKAQNTIVNQRDFNPSDLSAIALNKLIIQLADPFDGVNRSFLFTPLLARHLQDKWGALAVTQVGQSSGPKYGPNGRDLAKAIGLDEAPFVECNARIHDLLANENLPKYGMYIDQEYAAPALNEWVPLRRNIIKRPFMATTEKLIDTCGASIIIASAFHPSFTEKMANMIEDATDFPAFIIVRRGLEGTLCLGLGKMAELTCGVRKLDGTFEQFEFSFGSKSIGIDSEMEKLDYDVNAEDLAEKCKRFAEKGSSGDDRFDKCVKITLSGFDRAMEWVIPRLNNPSA